VQEEGSNTQDGSVTVERRKRGPDVWCFRWREGGPDGRRIHRRIVLGTADELKSIASARKAVVGLRREINLNDVRIRKESITLADLSRHFTNGSWWEAIPASPIQRGKLTKVISGNGSSLGGVSIGCLKFAQWKSNHG
jgi:hypothetical protein